MIDAGSRHGTSHVDPHFINVFGDTLGKLREVFLSGAGSQPFVMAGSGSLGWDMITANCTVPGERAVVISTGYFGDRWVDVCRTYGLTTTYVGAPTPGAVPTQAAIAAAVKEASGEGRVSLVTITHVDTSTGVRMDLETTAATIRRIAPDAVIAVDGVCALGAEVLRMEKWDIDAYLTGSQKALGVPPGLAIVVARPRALAAYERVAAAGAVRNYYCDWGKWMPIMKAYEGRTGAYYATPAVNLIYALHESVEELLANGGMEQRFHEHQAVADQFRQAMRQAGLGFVPVEDAVAANTMSAVRYPTGVAGAAFLAAVKKNGAVVAGGLHKEIKSEYFRVGHMGYTTRQPNLVYLVRTIEAIRQAILECNPSAKL